MSNIIIHSSRGDFSYDDSECIEHHGVLGQKWGVRRYQNADGSLTAAGKKHISKEYAKAQAKGDKQLQSNYNRLYIQAYNKSADTMNDGGIDKFNKSQEKKYGKDYANRDGYMKDYEEAFSKLFEENFSKTLSEFIDSNSDYKKAKSFVKQYNMQTWDTLAKQNSEYYDEIHKYA